MLDGRSPVTGEFLRSEPSPLFRRFLTCVCPSVRKVSSSSSTIRPVPSSRKSSPHLVCNLLYFFSLQVCNLNYLGSLLSSILCICSLQFILYCVNLSLILKMPNCSLMSLLLFLSKSVYPVIGLKKSHLSSFSFSLV